MHIRCIYNAKVYLHMKCEAFHFFPPFTQNICEHNIMIFKTHEMKLSVFISPLFISYLISEMSHAQVIKGILQMYFSVLLKCNL